MSRVGQGKTVDVTIGGWHEVKDLPLTKALVVDSGGAGRCSVWPRPWGTPPLSMHCSRRE